MSGSLYGHAAYPDPTVLQPALDAANSAFDTAISAQEMGGAAATAAKNARRAALIALLRGLAAYVQRKCNNDLATLLASGFKAVNTTRTSTLADGDVPAIRGIKNGNSTQLILRVKAVKDSRGTIIRYAVVGAGGVLGLWVETDPFTDSRRILIEGLTPGATDAFQARSTLARSGRPAGATRCST